MRGRRRLRALGRTAARVPVVALAVLVVTGWVPVADPALAAAPAGTPTAHSSRGIRSVGPLYFHGLGQAHGCTASVVHSRTHNVVMTAAHCIDGDGRGVLFAPGSVDGRSPNGVWTVQAVFVDGSWLRGQDPRHDYAFLRMAAQGVGGRSTDVEDVTGAASLGITAHHSRTVRVSGYPAGSGGAPITCRNEIIYTAGYPTFDCHGYLGGTSGSPFVAVGHGGRRWLTGLVGGLNQGGCHEWTSFSSPFTKDIYRSLRRAVNGRAPDQVPRAGGDGC